MGDLLQYRDTTEKKFRRALKIAATDNLAALIPDNYEFIDGVLVPKMGYSALYRISRDVMRSSDMTVGQLEAESKKLNQFLKDEKND